MGAAVEGTQGLAARPLPSVPAQFGTFLVWQRQVAQNVRHSTEDYTSPRLASGAFGNSYCCSRRDDDDETVSLGVGCC